MRKPDGTHHNGATYYVYTPRGWRDTGKATKPTASAIAAVCAKAKARRYYYAQRTRDLSGMKAASSEARRKIRAAKESQKAERQKRARVTREERRGARA
jgi:hypothetical protein